jgi:hypothetical protein
MAFDRRDFRPGDVIEMVYMSYIDPVRPGILGIVLNNQPILPGMLGVHWDEPYDPCGGRILGVMEATDSIKKVTTIRQEFVASHIRLFGVKP